MANDYYVGIEPLQKGNDGEFPPLEPGNDWNVIEYTEENITKTFSIEHNDQSPTDLSKEHNVKP